MIKIGKLRPTIGHMILNTALYFENDKPFTIIVNSKSEISNLAVYEIIKFNYQKSKKAVYMTGILYIYLYKIIVKTSQFVPFFSKILSDIDFIHRKTSFEPQYGSQYKFWSRHTFDRFPSFKVPNKIVEKFNNWKRVNGITGKFICVFARDDGYWGGNDQVVENIRNSSISELELTINYLIKKGFWVVRLGRDYSNSSGVLSIANKEKYIDYQNSKDVSDEVDVMLIRYTELFIGSNSGLSNIQLLFNTKMVLLNWAPAGLGPPYCNCQYIMKRYKKHGVLTPFRSIDKNILLSEDSEYIKEKGYSIEENKSDEILKIVSESINQDGKSVNNQDNYQFIVSKGRSTLNNEWTKDNKFLFN